jgi:hypothetical protein
MIDVHVVRFLEELIEKRALGVKCDYTNLAKCVLREYKEPTLDKQTELANEWRIDTFMNKINGRQMRGHVMKICQVSIPIDLEEKLKTSR